MTVTTLDKKNTQTAQRKKILLAEDDDSMRRFVEVVLKQAGYEVKAAEDGLAAMQFALETTFDAVVTDAIMPNFSGYDLCRAIRAGDGQKSIPCVILSGLKQENSDEATENIADARLVKDANLKNGLLSILEKLLLNSAQPS